MRGARPPARRVIGIETEFGITCASTRGGPPPLDADQAARELFEPVVRRGRSSNVFTRSGGRLYLDVGSHPEYATAECDRLEDLLAQDRAGELVMADLADQATSRLSRAGVEGRVHLLKTNLDAQGNGFGCHENYLVHRRASFLDDVRALVPHLVTRQLLVGSGHILPAADGAPARYVLSQRADQVWETVSSATTRARPMVNTRDEPLARAEDYRRVHVIVGDSNIAQGSTLLKVASVDLLLDYLESGGDLSDLALADPVRAVRDTCRDLSGGALLERDAGGTITAREVQEEHLGRVRSHVQCHRDLTGLQAAALDLWERGLRAVAVGEPDLVADELDWVAKLRLLTRLTERLGTDLGDPRAARLALAYHDVSATDGLRDRLEASGALRCYVDRQACQAAVDTPPATTRAHLRGRAVALAEDTRQDLTVDWVSLRLDDGSLPVISLRDPFAAADERVDALVAEMEARSARTFRRDLSRHDQENL
ncbi:Pup--protein ligase [Actinomyces wuliandei]|uniref:Pup--protein ligase n=1 Tax=Actinomyces wuliandei TaxID=2057743 RepID=UPI000FDBA9D7|nr:Pup--protein ligase [Actinomyces wuliandei]